MIKKIVLPLTLFLSMCAVTQVVSAASHRGGTRGADVVPARPVSTPAVLVGTLASWTSSDGGAQFGYTFPASSESYALAITSDGRVTALSTRQLKTAMLSSAGSIQFNGQVAPSTVKIIWSAGKVDGAIRSGYKLVLGGATYLWNGLSHVQQLTGTEALSFVTAP